MNDFEFLTKRNDSSIALKGLKPLHESSHNQDEHEHVIALVKFLARRAAEQDFETYLRAPDDHPDTLH